MQFNDEEDGTSYLQSTRSGRGRQSSSRSTSARALPAPQVGGAVAAAAAGRFASHRSTPGQHWPQGERDDHRVTDIWGEIGSIED